MHVRGHSPKDFSIIPGAQAPTADWLMLTLINHRFHGSVWNPPDDVRENIDRYLREVVRILVPGGTFLYISPRQPHFMKSLLAREDWDLSVETLPNRERGVLEYFAYIMKKSGQEVDTKDASDPRTQSGSKIGDEQNRSAFAESYEN